MPSVVRSPGARLLAALLVIVLGVALVVTMAGRPEPVPAPPRTVLARGSAGLGTVPDGGAEDAAGRTAAVEALLARRAQAVLSRDRAAFLGGVDPRSGPFLERQGALFDALADVPLTAWSYTVDPAGSRPPDAALDARYGTWWAPRVTLRHALEGIDDVPAESRQVLTFVLRGGLWWIAADDDVDLHGEHTARALWDSGPVVVERGQRTLVLGHPASREQMKRLARDLDEAVPRVSAVWGADWAQRVAVLVPADQAELGRLVDTGGSLTPIAALAVAGPVQGGAGRGGDRVLVNPGNLDRLGPVARRVVLTHEVAHVAARAATGPLVPAWLSEGLADHVGFLGTDVPVRSAAEDLARDVRAGRLPAALPRDEDFDGDDPALAQAYEGSWLAVELLVDTYGQDRVLALYRALGTRTAGDPGQVLDEVLRARLGTDVAALTAGWVTTLTQRLG